MSTNQVWIPRRPLLTRLWHALGYGMNPLPCPERLYGVTSEVHARLDFADRLRVLLSGHVVVQVQVNLDRVTEITGPSLSTVSVLPPGVVSPPPGPNGYAPHGGALRHLRKPVANDKGASSAA